MATFRSYNPSVIFLYFAFIIFLNMFVTNPVIQVISLITGIFYSILLKKDELKTSFFLYIAIIILISPIFNAAFNHAGTTTLFYTRNQNPVTLESIIYGFNAGLMFANLIIWFFIYSELMTSDKFMYLFANKIPAISLALSMILRFIPRYGKRLEEIHIAKEGIGEGLKSDKLIDKINYSMVTLSALITWALENGVDSSQSMRARGYGIGRRTSYTNYSLTSRDKILLGIYFIFFVFSLYLFKFGQLKVYFFPEYVFLAYDSYSMTFYILYLSFIFLPVILEIMEEIKWKYLM